MTGERYQLRRDVPLSDEQRRALVHAFDELLFSVRFFRQAGHRMAARRTARHTRRMVKAFGEKWNPGDVSSETEVTHGANTKGPAMQSAVDDNVLSGSVHEFFPAHESNAARLGKNGEGRDSLRQVGASVAERQTTRTA